MPSTSPYGTWRSPITAESLASQTIGLGSVRVDGPDLYWLEVRPQEGGRVVLVRQDAGVDISDLVGTDVNVRTRVHEYGGGAFCVHARMAFYVNFQDQRVYRQRGRARAVPITPEAPLRYADFLVDDARRRLLCVREDHRGEGEAVNTLVALPMDDEGVHEGRVLASGHDFYSTPRVSPDGRLLAWLAWRHPNMPWDGTELWLASIGADGGLEAPRVIAGGPTESIVQPGWSPDGSLYFISDRDDWWRFYRIDASTVARAGAVSVEAAPVLTSPPEETEFGHPQWSLGMQTWTFLNPSTIVSTFTRRGRAGIASIDVQKGTCRDIGTALEPLDDIAVINGALVFVGSSASTAPALVRCSVSGEASSTIRVSSSTEVDAAYLSTAEAITFPSAGGVHAHAFFYAPRNPKYVAPAGEKPPLMVIIHGGPTSAAKPTLRYGIQYWTSRGFAVVDVDYGGSSGFGRAYRERLNGEWGVVDVDDCVHAALYLVEQGRVDPARLTIRGGSAGGYTTLAALTFHPGVFKAAASHYGICDLEALAGDTHKFESRYGDTLIGPYPQARETYRARSPIHYVDRLACPLILFHGAEDKVVPVNQAQMMAEALRAKQLPVALVVFEGEQHGFRRAASVIRSLEAELWFYGTVFGFTPADPIEPVDLYLPPNSA